MSHKFRKALTLANYAGRSPRSFVQAARSACDLMLDSGFSKSGRLPNIPLSFLNQIGRFEIKLPCLNALTDGTQDLPGLAFIASLARGLQVRSVLEIGTFTGLTALIIAMNCPDAVVHTLDLPPTAHPVLNLDQADTKYATALPRARVYERRPEAGRITQHEGDSARFDFHALGRKFDLVYIDGSHSYEYVANDSRAAFSIVSDRGVIVWDDYQRVWPGVVRYLSERVDLELHTVPGTRLVVWFAAPSCLANPAASSHNGQSYEQ